MPTSEAQKRASIKYAQNNYKRVPLDLKFSYYNNILKPAADAAGLKVNAFIKEAIEDKIERMKNG